MTVIFFSQDETTAYLLLGQYGFEILDISDIFNPVSISRTDYVGADMAISSDENRAYIATRTGLLILDISNKAEPTLLGQYDRQDEIIVDPWRMQLSPVQDRFSL